MRTLPVVKALQTAVRTQAAMAGADSAVEVVLQDGEPTLRVTEAKAPPADAPVTEPVEEFDARITLRLPPSLKEAVEQAAVTQGASVNAWVVDAIDRTAKRARRRGGSYTQEFDL